MEKYGSVGEGSFCLEPDARPDTLLNDATEWLQYARGLTDLLIESMEDSELPDRRKMMLALGAIATLTTMGTECVAQAHAKMQWDRV
ncbi:MAG: hypothetical protein ABW137_02505 [Mycobacterium sp.]